MANWSVYMIQSRTDNRLYTGVSTDPERRQAEHNEGRRGAKATRRGRPWDLVYVEPAVSKNEALKREAAIKKLSRDEKLKLLEKS